jgi:predicted acyl esterase
MRGSIMRGWKALVAHGYTAVYQDCRGRHGSEGEDRVYADKRAKMAKMTDRSGDCRHWL